MLFRHKKVAAAACRLFYKTTHPDYLPTSGVIPFDYFQSSLPRLPIPRLDETLERYLRSQRAVVLDESEYAITVKAVNSFRHGIGPELQDRLRQRETSDWLSCRHNSYVSDVWYSWGYLGSRSPLPLWYNPTLSYAEVSYEKLGHKTDRQLAAATNYIISTLRFVRSLDNGSLAPTLVGVARGSDAEDRFLHSIRYVPRALAGTVARRYFGVTPIDVSQFTRLFRSSRIPKEDGDDVWRTMYRGEMTLNGGSVSQQRGEDPYVLDFDFSTTKNTIKHVVVFCSGSLFKLRVLDEHGCIESAAEIYRRLAFIRGQAAALAVRRLSQESGTALVPFGTTMERSCWAKLRRRIEAHSDSSRAAFNAVDSALFAVALSDVNTTDDSRLNKHFLVPETDSETAIQNGPGSAQDGRSSDSVSAWFDKSFTLLLTRNGRCAVNWEHSYADGVAVVRMMREVHADVVRQPALALAPDAEGARITTPASETINKEREYVEALRFDCDEQVRKQLEDAAHQYRQLRSCLSLASVRIANGGRRRAKAQRVSADALAQLAVQLAYARLFRRIGVVYESCSTASFRAGRTETIRSASPYTRKFIDAFLGARRSELLPLLRACSMSHTLLVREASTGMGWDRHLLALQNMAGEFQQHSPIGLYNDPAYRRIKHIDVSTSQLTEPQAIDAFAFGPVELDCVGVAYQVHDDHVRACITSYPQHTNGVNGARFGELVAEHLQEFNRLFDAASSVKQ